MTDKITLHGRAFKKMIDASEIDAAVSKVAQQLNEKFRDMEESPLVLGILNGSFMFMSDLVKKFDFDAELSFLKLSSYEGTESVGTVKSLIGLNNSIEGRHVIVIEDIVDSGTTIRHIDNDLKSRNPASVSYCTLFFKPGNYTETINIDFKAMDIGNEFIVGYGLDFDYLGRTYKDIYVIDNE